MPLTIIIIIIIIIDIATLCRRCRPEGRGEPAAADGRPRDRGGPRAGRRLGPGGAQVQYSTVQYSTVQCSTVQYSTWAICNFLVPPVTR